MPLAEGICSLDVVPHGRSCCEVDTVEAVVVEGSDGFAAQPSGAATEPRGDCTPGSGEGAGATAAAALAEVTSNVRSLPPVLRRVRVRESVCPVNRSACRPAGET